jgi:hypothetical protein
MADMANQTYWPLGGHIQCICAVIATADALHQQHDHCKQAQSGMTRRRHVVP